MDITPILVVGIIFGALVAIILGPGYLKSRDRKEVQATVRAAIDKGQPLPPEVIEAMGKEATRNIPSRTRDIRRGVIWLAVGAGIAAFSLLNGHGWSGDGWDVNVGSGLLGIAAIPATIGVAFIILSFFNKNKD
ncbi:DUF6249 domain-containing protein [soil metagenome]